MEEKERKDLTALSFVQETGQKQPEAQEQEQTLRFPSGNIPNLIQQTLAAGTGETFTTEEGFLTFKEKMEAAGHGRTTYQLKAPRHRDGEPETDEDGKALIPGNRRTVIRDTPEEVTAVTISDITKMAASNTTARNVVDSILYEAGLHYLTQDRQLQKDAFTISYDNLVKYGVASNRSNVKRMVNSVVDLLGGIRVFRQAKRPGDIPDLATLTIFPTVVTNRKGLYVRLNSDLDWSEVIQGFLTAPDYLWDIKARNTKSLLLYVCDMIRIRKLSTFTVSLRAVIARLGLPSEKETKSPQERIINVLKDAIDEINRMERRSTGDNSQLQLQLKIKKTGRVSDRLDSGEIVVRAGGRLIEKAEEIKGNQATIIKKLEARKERAKAAAIKKVAEEMVRDQLEQLKADKPEG